MSTQTPNLAAIIPSPKARFVYEERSIPTPGPGELLIRNYAIAANPVDWKIQDFSFAVKTYPTILGSDAAGVVISTGSPTSRFRAGDRVTGFTAVIYNDDIDHGAWQTYTLLKEGSTTKIPEFMTYEAAATLPMGMATSAVSLFATNLLSLPLPTLPLPSSPQPQKSAFLIWGASSSVGVSTLQLVHLLGYSTYVTSSPKHNSYLQSLGATAVYDHHSPTVVQDIITAAKEAGTPITLAVDAIGTSSTLGSCISIVQSSAGSGGKICHVTPGLTATMKDKIPQGIEITETGAYRHAIDEKEMGTWFFNEFLEQALAEEKIVGAPEVQVVEGGVRGAQEALDLVKKGVSGRKVVVKLE